MEQRPPTDHRTTALWLMVILGLFILAMSAVVTATYITERREGVLTSSHIAALKAQLNESPQDENLKQEIRRVDLDLRNDYYRNRRRFQTAGYFLLFALLAWILAFKWRLTPAGVPLPVAPEEVAERPNPNRAVLGVIGSTLLLLAVLGFFTLTSPTDLPPVHGEPRIAAADIEIPPELTWPGFRGHGNLGLAAEADWPTTWSATANRNVIWKTPVGIPGNSSPVVWGDRIFLTGAREFQLHVMCYRRDTGQKIWNKLVAATPPATKIKTFSDTGMAAPTPTTDGRRIYAIFGTGLLVALDFEGREVWVRNLGVPDSLYGFASSPILYDDLLLIQFDQGSDSEEGKSKLLGIDTSNGKIRWEVTRPVANSWASPSLIETGGRAMLIACGETWVIAYDPSSGKELWRADVLMSDIAPSPAFGGGLVFATNDGAALFAIRPDGTGDVTKTHVAWNYDDGMPDTSSPVADGERVLQATSGGLVTCINTEDGSLLWEEFLDSGSIASPILAGENVYLFGEDGVTRIYEWGDSARRIDEGEVGEHVMATPAFVASRIYLRGAEHLFCIGRTP